jgi:serine/threonine protein phosphatase 1
VESAWKKAHQNPKYKFSTYDEIFVGHTTTQWFARNKETKGLAPEEIAKLGTEPLFLCNVIILDTGAGWSGRLTIMDVNSHEYWQSDLTPKLYGMEGRK